MRHLRTILTGVAALTLILAAGITIGCQHTNSGQTNDRKASYYCPMHPEVVQNSPGKCPDCGMDLVEKQ
jgi:hypothetical protein